MAPIKVNIFFLPNFNELSSNTVRFHLSTMSRSFCANIVVVLLHLFLCLRVLCVCLATFFAVLSCCIFAAFRLLFGH